MQHWSWTAVVLGLLACSEGPSPTAPLAAPGPPSVQLGPEGVSIPVGTSYQLSVAALNAEVTGWTWATSETAYATVSPAGVVQGVRPGVVGIRACATNRPLLCGQVTVFVIAMPSQGPPVVVVQPAATAVVVGGGVPYQATAVNHAAGGWQWALIPSTLGTVDVGGRFTAARAGVGSVIACTGDPVRVCGTAFVTVH